MSTSLCFPITARHLAPILFFWWSPRKRPDRVTHLLGGLTFKLCSFRPSREAFPRLFLLAQSSHFSPALLLFPLVSLFRWNSFRNNVIQCTRLYCYRVFGGVREPRDSERIGPSKKSRNRLKGERVRLHVPPLAYFGTPVLAPGHQFRAARFLTKMYSIRFPRILLIML